MTNLVRLSPNTTVTNIKKKVSTFSQYEKVTMFYLKASSRYSILFSEQEQALNQILTVILVDLN